MGSKQKRITREDLEAAVNEHMDARSELHRQRAQRYAENALRKITQGKFSISEGRYRFDGKPYIQIKLWFTREFDLRHFLDVLTEAGYPEAETDSGDFPFTEHIRIPIAQAQEGDSK